MIDINQNEYWCLNAIFNFTFKYYMLALLELNNENQIKQDFPDQNMRKITQLQGLF